MRSPKWPHDSLHFQFNGTIEVLPEGNSPPLRNKISRPEISRPEPKMMEIESKNFTSGGWILVYVWLSPFVVHLKLSKHC